MKHKITFSGTRSAVAMSGDLHCGQFGIIAGGTHVNYHYEGKLLMRSFGSFVLVDDPYISWTEKADDIPLSRILRPGEQFTVTVGK